MIWKLIRITLWLPFSAIAGLTGVSYFHDIHAGIDIGEQRALVVSIADGTLDLGYYAAESKTDRYPAKLAEFICNRRREGSFGSFQPYWYDSDLVGFGAFGLRPFLQHIGAGGWLLIPVLAFPVGMWTVRRRRSLAGAIREILRPSNRSPKGFAGRFIRRAALCTVAAAAMVLTGTCAASYTHSFRDHCWYVGKESLLLTNMEIGRVKVVYVSCVAGGAKVPKVEKYLGMFGFQQTSRPSVLPGGQGPPMANAAGQAIDVTRVLWFPAWAPALLLSIWPVIAFLRGPYRRAVRRAKDLCPGCGYSITGLPEPRCPECGTGTAMSSVSQAE